MARVSNPEKPRSRQVASPLIRLDQVSANYIPEPGEEPVHDSERSRHEREAAALKLYWDHLVREMRAVDYRLEELDALLA